MSAAPTKILCARGPRRRSVPPSRASVPPELPSVLRWCRQEADEKIEADERPVTVGNGLGLAVALDRSFRSSTVHTIHGSTVAAASQILLNDRNQSLWRHSHQLCRHVTGTEGRCSGPQMLPGAFVVARVSNFLEQQHTQGEICAGIARLSRCFEGLGRLEGIALVIR